jgi:hypothetical protein
MADWRSAVEKVLKSEKPRKFRRSTGGHGPDHGQVVDQQGDFPADEFIRFNPGLNPAKSPAETRMDTGVSEGEPFVPFFPVFPGASIKKGVLTNLPTYSREYGHLIPPTDAIPHAHFPTHREKPDKREKIGDAPHRDGLVPWSAWMRGEEPPWLVRGRPDAEVSHSVWSEAESAWHLRHHPPPDPDRCAGCGEWLLDGPGMRLPDGAVVHFGNPDRFDCPISYDMQWRQAASWRRCLRSARPSRSSTAGWIVPRRSAWRGPR